MNYFYSSVIGFGSGIVLVARGLAAALIVFILLSLTSLFLFSREP